LIANRVTATGNSTFGLDAEEFNAGNFSATLTDVVSSGNGEGIYFEFHGTASPIRLTRVTAADNVSTGLGISALGPSGTIDVAGTDVHIDHNGADLQPAARIKEAGGVISE
jgi:hypothetical protein